jgi:hypothetical protein
MATAVRQKVNKTEFAKQVLGKNGRANAAAVNEAWTAAGREGSISAALVNKLRSTLGLAGNLRARRKKRDDQPQTGKLPYTGKKRGRKPKNPLADVVELSPSHANGRNVGAGAGARGRTTVHLRALQDVESDIDRLIFKVMALGGMSEIEDTLRHARRLLYGGFSGTPF